MVQLGGRGEGIGDVRHCCFSDVGVDEGGSDIQIEGYGVALCAGSPAQGRSQSNETAACRKESVVNFSKAIVALWPGTASII